MEHGPDYGYYPNASKTWIVVKEDKVDAAVAAFQGTEVNITIEGRDSLEQLSALGPLLRSTSIRRLQPGSRR